MSSHPQLQTKMFEKFQELKLRNERYSLRAFSRKLGIGAGAVSQILSGKRNVSAKLAVKICEKLLFDPVERAEVLGPFKKTKNVAKPKHDSFVKLTQEQFLAISQWQHFAILSLVKISGAKGDSSWIAQRLGISEKEASLAVKRLIHLGLLEKKNGALKRIAQPIRTTDDLKDLTLRAAHVETLEIAKHALLGIPVEHRDFTTVTLPLLPEKIPQAKELIREFQNQFFSLFEDVTSPAQVYRLSMELFPLSKLESK
ncbi:MAG: TIGR02147 family protein [Cryobacterium sp.]|nr:TIGR02147 family protein [Oligoflexia bacterium]